MDKVNKQFIIEMQKRLDEKDLIYGGEMNTRNYKNMDSSVLLHLINKDIKCVYSDPLSEREYRKKLVDIANRCGMAWEKSIHK